MKHEIKELCEGLISEPSNLKKIDTLLKKFLEKNDINSFFEVYREEVLKKVSSPETRTILLKSLSYILKKIGEREENPLLQANLYLSAVNILIENKIELDEAVQILLETWRNSKDPRVLWKILELSKMTDGRDFRYRILKGILKIEENENLLKEAEFEIKNIEKEIKTEINDLKIQIEKEKEGETKGLKLFKVAKLLFTLDPHSIEGEEHLFKSSEFLPKNEVIIRSIEELLKKQKRFKELSQYLKSCLLKTEDEKLHLYLHKTLGYLFKNNIKDLQNATFHFEEGFKINPKEREILTQLINIYSAKKEWDSALKILERGLQECTDKEEEEIFLEELGEIYYNQINNIEKAEKYFRRLRTISPRNLKAMKFYENYYQMKEDWQKLFSVLSTRIPVTENETEKISLLLKLADISENKLHNLDRTIEAYKRILSTFPSHKEAEEALIVLYEKTKKWHALIEFYNAKIKQLPEEAVDEKVSILFKIIEIYQNPDKLPHEDMVLHTYSRIVELCPTNIEALNILAKKFESRENWGELLSVLQKQVEITENTENLLELFHKISEIAINRMANTEQALPFLEKILELDPQNRDVVQKLKEIYKSKVDIEKLYLMYQKDLKFEHDLKKREEILLELATIAMEKLFRYQDAISFYEEVFRINPENEKVIDALQRLYPKLQRYGEYIDFLEELATREKSKSKKVYYLEQIGKISLGKHQDKKKARKIFEEVLSIYPESSYARGLLEKLYFEERDFTSLRSLYFEKQDYSGYCSLLKRELLRVEKDEEKEKFHLEIGECALKYLGDEKTGYKHLESAFLINPQLLNIGKNVALYYEKKGILDKAIEINKLLLFKVKEEEEKITLLEKIATFEEKRGFYENAFNYFVDIFKLKGIYGDISLLPKLSFLAEKTENFPSLVEVLQEILPSLSETEIKASVLEGLGAIYKENLGLYDTAVQFYKMLLQIKPSNLKVLKSLEDLEIKRKDYPSLEEIYKLQIPLIENVEEKKEIYFKLATLYEDVFANDEKLIDCGLCILKLSPEEQKAIAILKRAYERSEKFQELTELLQTQISLLEEEKEKEKLSLYLAEIFSTKLNEKEKAISIYEEIVKKNPSQEIAISALKSIFKEAEHRKKVFPILKENYLRRERFRELPEILHEIIPLYEKREEKIQILKELSEIYEDQLGDAISSFQCRKEIFNLNPSDEFSFAELSRIAINTGQIRELAIHIGRWVGILPETERVSIFVLDSAEAETRLTLSLAKIYEDYLNDDEMAIKCYEKVLPYEYDNYEVLNALSKLYEKKEMFEQLVQIYIRKVELTWESNEKKLLFCKIAEIYNEKLKNLEEGINYLKEAFHIDERDNEVISNLENCYLSLQRWEDLLSLLRHKLLFTTQNDDKAEIFYHIGIILRDHIGKIEEAIEQFKEVLKIKEAQEEAVSSLHSILHDETILKNAGIVEKITEVLEPIYRKKKDFLRLIDVLKFKAEISASPSLRAEIFKEIAKIEEQNLKNIESSFEFYSKSFKEWSDDIAVLDKMTSLSQNLKNHNELISILEEVQEVAKLSTRKAILKRMADILENVLNDYENAILNYEKILEIDHTDTETMRKIDSLLHKMGKESERIPLLQQLIDWTPQILEKREIYKNLADISETMGDFETAISSYAYIFEHLPSEGKIDTLSEQAFKRLCSLYIQEERFRDYVRTSLTFAELIEDEKEKKVLYLNAAKVLEEKIQAIEESLEIYKKVYDIDPYDNSVKEKIYSLCAKTQKWETYEEHLRKELTYSESEEETLKILFSIGELYEKNIGDYEKAMNYYEEILSRNPSHENVIECLYRILEIKEWGMQASSLLEKAYRISENWDKLSQQLIYQINNEPELLERGRKRLELKSIYIEKLKNLQKAKEVLKQGFISDPLNEKIFEEMLALYSDLDAFDEIYNITQEALVNIKTSNERTILREKIGNFLIKKGIREEAKSLFKQNLEEEPSNIYAINILEKLFEEDKNYRELIDILLHKVQETHTLEEKKNLIFKIAEIEKINFQSLENAKFYYKKILELDPLCKPAYREIEKILIGDGKFEELHQLLSEELSNVLYIGDTERRTELRLKIANIFKENFNNPSQALGILKEEIEDGNFSSEIIKRVENLWIKGKGLRDCFMALEKVYKEKGDEISLYNLYRDCANVEESAEDKENLLSLCIEIAKRQDLKKNLFTDLMELSKLRIEDREINENLKKIAFELEKYEELLKHYEEIYKQYFDSQEIMVEAGKELGNLYANYLSRPDDAIDIYKVILSRDVENEEVKRELIELLQKLHKWEEIGFFYEQEGDRELSIEKKKEYYFKAGEIFTDRVIDKEHAVEIYSKILDISPQDENAISYLENYYREKGDKNSLLKVLGLKLSTVGENKEKISLLFEIGDIQRKDRKDYDSAVECYREIRQMEPQNERALKELEEIFKNLARFQELIALYREWKEYVEGPKKIEFLSKMAQIYEQFLDAKEEAIECLNEILGIDEKNAFALRRLGSLYEKTQNYEGFLRIFEKRVEIEEDVEEKISLIFKIGNIVREKLKDPLSAIKYFKQILNISPSHSETRKILDELLKEEAVSEKVCEILIPIVEKEKDYKKLLSLFRIKLNFEEKEEQKKEILWKCAEIQEKNLGKYKEGLFTMGEILSIIPEDEGVYEKMLNYAKKYNLWEEAVNIFSSVCEKISNLEVSLKIKSLIGEIYENKILSNKRAINIYLDILKEHPYHLGTINALERLYEKEAMFEKLTEILRQKLLVTEEEEHFGIKKKLAEIYYKKIEDIESAFDIYKEIFLQKRDDREIENAILSIGKNPLFNFRVVSFLKPIYEREEDRGKLIELYRMELEFCEDKGRKFDIISSMAKIFSEIKGGEREAFNLYGKAFVLNPSSIHILKPLEELTKELNDYQNFAVILKNAISNIEISEIKIELLIKLGEISLQFLKDEDFAEQAFEEALKLDPTNIFVMERLERIKDKKGKLNELSNILLFKVKLPLSLKEKKRIFARLTEISLLRKEIKNAADYLTNLVQIDPTDLHALLKLKTILLELNDYKGLAFVNEKIAEISDNPSVRIKAYMDSASIYKDLLASSQKAISLLEDALKIEPENLNVLKALEKLYDETMDYKSLEETLYSMLSIVKESREKVKILIRLSKIAEDYQKNSLSAIEYLRLAYKEGGESEGAILDELIRLYHNEGMWKELIEVYELKAKGIKVRGERADIYTFASKIAIEKLGNEEIAISLLEKAVEENPLNSETLWRIAQLKEERGEKEEALKYYEQLSKILQKPEEKFETLVKIGKLLIEKEEERERAKAILNSALSIFPDNKEVILLLKDLLREGRSYEEIVNILKKEIKLIESSEEKAKKALEIALIYRDNLKNDKEFLSWIEEAEKLKPDDPEIIKEYVDFFLAKGEPKRIVKPLEWYVNFLDAKKKFSELPKYAFLVARIFEDMGNKVKAKEYYKLGFKYSPQDVKNGIKLAKFYMEDENYEHALEIFRSLILQAGTIEKSFEVEILYNLSYISFLRGEKVKAKQYLTRAIEINPEHEESKELLKKLK